MHATYAHELRDKVEGINAAVQAEWERHKSIELAYRKERWPDDWK